MFTLLKIMIFLWFVKAVLLQGFLQMNLTISDPAYATLIICSAIVLAIVIIPILSGKK